MKEVLESQVWDYLAEEWEIKYLTAEACGVGLRARVDVGPAGQLLLSQLFGGMELMLPGWNEPAWKTMMWPYSLTADVVVWSLLQAHDIVLRVISSYTRPMYRAYSAAEFDYSLVDNWRELGFSVRAWNKNGTAASGLMNQHVMSGRVW